MEDSTPGMWGFIPLTVILPSAVESRNQGGRVDRRDDHRIAGDFAAPRAEEQAGVSDYVRLIRTRKLRLAPLVDDAMLPDEVLADYRILANQEGEAPPPSMLIR
jgi:hypothetical protein